MADPVTIRGALDLRPEDAIRAFRQRDELKVSVSYRDLAPEEHARAFTAAKVAKLDILAALGGSLDTALKEGQTFAQWRDGILPTLQREGWWGLIQDEALTGTSEPVFVGERRLRTIFATNMRVSRAAGQWARIQALKGSRPFLRYSAVLDNRTRPLHARWHGTIRPVDDPIWQAIYPPNGWNCFLPGTRVIGRPVAGARIWHDGKAIELATAAGRKLSATADHPILTRRGWVMAKHLVKGDQLLGYRLDADALDIVHDDQAPTLVEELFQSLAPKLPAVGQGPAHDLDHDLRLDHGDTGAVTVDCELGAADNASCPGGSALALDPLGRLLDGFPLCTFRLGSAANDHALLAELAAEGCAADAGLFGQLLQAGAGDTAADEVVDVRQFDFRGHVYDFQTVSGLIVAEGLVTHNCRCQVQQLDQRDLDRRGYVVTPDGELPDLGPTGSAWFGVPRQRRDVIRGIDAGWDYNPGAATLRGMARKVVDSIKAAEIRDLDRVAMQTIEEIASDPVMRSALIDELADRATRDTAFNFILPLGRLGRANSADITRLTGLPMDGVIRAIDAQDIRHALKRHGNAKAEDKINQIALKVRDFALVDAIVAEPDTVEALGRVSARKPLRMRYFKRFGGTVYELVEYFAPQLRQWRLKTFLKKVSPR